MTYRIRNVNDAVIAALVKAHNDERRAQISTEFHYDISGDDVTGDVRDPTQNDLQVTAADGDGSLAVLLTLCANLSVIYAQHIADAHVHDMADTSNEIAAPIPTDLTEAQTFLNEMKADYNLHLAQASVHPNDDGTNDSTAAAATNQATSDTLADELKADLNAHMNDALVGQGIQLISP